MLERGAFYTLFALILVNGMAFIKYIIAIEIGDTNRMSEWHQSRLLTSTSQISPY